MTIENQTPLQKSKPPYLLGLLCLIPLIGALVGIALLLFGIIKYKDKLLIAIGAFGILFTVGIYSFLFYYMKHGDLSKKGFAEISQMQLNSLEKNVEFYKLQHGHYPDSLQQLLDDDKLAPINDAIQIVQQRQNSYYNYQKIGGKYRLFSSGQDAIPNTPDDLIPQMPINDSSKIGWINSN
jgi:ABC-type antimicrobial peptide transport system permease subunit